MSKRSKPHRDADEPFADAMRGLIAERWGTLWAAMPAALAGDDIEGVHDVRVASRRLRAAMDVAAPCFPASWYRSLHRTAKAITAELGAVRDRDVLAAALRAEFDAVAPSERPGIMRLIDRVEAERAEARREMEVFVASVLDSGLPAAVEARFGRAAAPPPDLASGSTRGVRRDGA